MNKFKYVERLLDEKIHDFGNNEENVIIKNRM